MIKYIYIIKIIKNKKWFMYNPVFAQPEVMGECKETFSLGEHISTLDSLGKKYQIENIQRLVGLLIGLCIQTLFVRVL